MTAAAGADGANKLWIGTDRTDITPHQPVPLAGFAARATLGPASSVRAPLQLRTLAFADPPCGNVRGVGLQGGDPAPLDPDAAPVDTAGGDHSRAGERDGVVHHVRDSLSRRTPCAGPVCRTLHLCDRAFGKRGVHPRRRPVHPLRSWEIPILGTPVRKVDRPIRGGTGSRRVAGTH
jgi:hypothetical protein